MTLIWLKQDQFICRYFCLGHFFSLSLYFVSSTQAIISYPGHTNNAMESNRIDHLSPSLINTHKHNVWMVRGKQKHSKTWKRLILLQSAHTSMFFCFVFTVSTYVVKFPAGKPKAKQNTQTYYFHDENKWVNKTEIEIKLDEKNLILLIFKNTMWKLCLLLP